MIEIEALSYRIGATAILRQIDLTLPERGIVALVGPNGAGKSSLLAHLARLRPIQSGRIRIDGLELGRCDDMELARKLAILPQEPPAAARLSVRDLVRFGRYPHCRGRLRPEDEARVDRALAAFDLVPLAARFLDTLSGGQRQKAQIAMTYAQDTRYLLLDEPLNNLDIAAARGLMQLLRRLADREGKAIVIVLHDINAATRYADRLVVMKAGQVVAEGAPGDLVDAALMRRVFDTDAPVLRVDGRPVVLP